MSTFLDYLTVLAVAALLFAPALHGAARERLTDRQLRAAQRLRAAQQEPQVVRDGHRREEARPRTPRVAVRHAPGR